jgi:hypothetical protein
MSNRQNSRPKEITKNELPTLYVDGVTIGHRDDGMNYVSLTTNVPHYIIEQVRFIIDDEHLRGMIDVLCRSIDYSPEKTGKKPRRPSK